MKKTVKIIAIAIVAVVCAFAMYSSTCDVELSDLQNENLEALATGNMDGEDLHPALPRVPKSGSGPCFSSGGDCMGEVIVIGDLPK